ncbi:MAG TPA: hypothetical protein VJT73_05920 [Polyangiaceae bacterium]|nr:hypothetical protein [Polyangiaceae bacterium]
MSPLLHRRLVCSATGIAQVVFSTALRAEAPGPQIAPLHVVAIQSDDVEEQADALTAALRNRVRAMRGYSLSDGDFALEVLTLGLKCGSVPDVACQAKIADQIHADRYIWGSVKAAASRYLVAAELHYWEKGRAPSRVDLTYSSNLATPGDEGLRIVVEGALARLVEPPRSPSPEPAQPVALLGLASRPNGGGHASLYSEEFVTESRGSGHSTVGWAGVGLGGVLIAAGLYSVVRVHDIDTNERVDHYRQGLKSGVDPCEQARAGVDVKVMGAASPTEMRDFCSQQTTFQTLQYAFFGVGAVAAGAGIFLLATDKGSAQAGAHSRITIAPSVGSTDARVHLKMTF